MENINPNKPDALAAYTIIMLRHAESYLLLQRANTKRFAPGRWTGIGGLVEPHEISKLHSAALRELGEEAGISETEIAHFTLRRVLLHARPDSPLTVLLYFTGTLNTYVLPECTEGTLTWVTLEELPDLDVIESTRPVLPLLISDQERDPHGNEAVFLGLADYRANGQLDQVIWV